MQLNCDLNLMSDLDLYGKSSFLKVRKVAIVTNSQLSFYSLDEVL